MDNTPHLLINLLVILISLLFLQYWMHQLHVNQKKTNIVIFFTLTITIAFCMFFPIKITGGIIFDLRFIPFVLGCLYANKLTRRWTLVLIIAIRLSYGTAHTLFPIFSIILFYYLIIQLKPLYFRLPMIGKVSLSTTLMFFMSIWILAGVSLLYHTYLSLPLCISYILIQTAGMFIVGASVEIIKDQQLVLRRLIRMEKMEVASHLAASISHEIRNPLTSTRGFLQLLSEAKEIPDDMKEYITIASGELDQAEAIIREYLTFAKPAPKIIENIDIQTEIEKAVRIIEPLAKMNGITITANPRACCIKGNPGMFQQVLINIIKNGIEAMNTGGTITIGNKLDHSTAIITIKDEGVGMNDSQKSRLGEPYYSTKEAKGTGLGMMVVFRIVESMNGSLHVDSKVGMGTKITLKFPIC